MITLGSPLVATLLLAGLVAGCAVFNSTKNEAPHWSYHGKTGPEYWGSLDPSYTLLDEGKNQSPIDLSGAVSDASLPRLEIDYSATPISVLNNGHTIQQNYAPGSSVTVDGKAYELLQFHFHSKSEHTVEGKHFPLEMHCVHKAADGALLVIGILFELGKEDPTLAKVWSHIPTEPNVTNEDADVMVNAADVIGDASAYFHYAGSLTTPPGTEGVAWYVLTQPRQISSAQLEAFQAIYDHNYRPIQPLNGRALLRR